LKKHRACSAFGPVWHGASLAFMCWADPAPAEAKKTARATKVASLIPLAVIWICYSAANTSVLYFREPWCCAYYIVIENCRVAKVTLFKTPPNVPTGSALAPYKFAMRPTHFLVE
jgi:hypothetical protein